MFNLPTYRTTPSAHPVKCPPQCPPPSHPHPPPTSPSTTPSSFPRVRSLSCSVSLSDTSHSFFSPFLFIPFHNFSYSPNEWDHIMFVLLRLTYFTQHNTLQFHPRWSKWWVFVVSNGWVIFHCIHRPHLLYPLIFRRTPRLLPQFGYCGHCCYKHWGAGVPAFHCICIFGVNPSNVIAGS